MASDTLSGIGHVAADVMTILPAARLLGDPRLHFGGPDLEPRALRNLLKQRIQAVPPGGEIAWTTYYFRDRDLAAALIAACDRGVRVHLRLEGKPRCKAANRKVLEMLRAHGLRSGLQVSGTEAWKHSKFGNLHSKIYVFSHPVPTAFVGSFNPSGDVPEDQAIIDEIGDQDRGHNLLVEFTSPELVTALRHRAINSPGMLGRLGPTQNRAIRARQTTAWFYPRLAPDVVGRHLRSLKRPTVSAAISHLKGGSLATALCDIARKGGEVRLIVHDTERRVPSRAVAELKAAGVEVHRFSNDEGLPMHCKFLLVSDAGTETAFVGSLNHNLRSYYLNEEVLLATREPEIVSGLKVRMEQLVAMCR